MLSELSIDKVNVRKTARRAEPIFAASIRRKGVIEPLIVRPNGQGYKITNGGKRFDALQFLRDHQESAKGIAVTDAYPVPIVVRAEDDAAARDTSLATNIVRSAIHPVDEFEAFAELVSDGVSIKDVAETYALTANEVEQRLALGKLSSMVRAAWRDGTIKKEDAQAFTLSTDHAQQDKILKRLIKGGEFRYGGRVDRIIRHAIVGDKQGDAVRFVKLVGIEVYEKAGGTVVRDLFQGQHAVSDPSLAKRLAEEKIAATCGDLTAAGWSWAKPDAEIQDKHLYGGINKNPTHTKEEKATLKALEKIIREADEGEREDDQEVDSAREEYERINNEAECRRFTAEDKAKSGCAVGITNDGKLLVTYGLIPPSERKDKAGAGARVLADDDTSERTAAPAPKKPSNKISNALERRLREQRDTAVKAALNAHPHKDDLGTLLASLTAKMIQPTSQLYQGMTPHTVNEAMGKIADAIAPKIMGAALLKAFDAEDYFKSAPAKLRVRALEEMGCAARPAKAGEVIKLCTESAEKKKWLAPELRTSHYDGPGAKARSRKKAA